MYTVYATSRSGNRVLIYNDQTPELDTTKLINPKLQLKENTAGSFEATIPQENSCYSMIEPITTTIEVYKNGNWIWEGRILTIEKDFWLHKKITCEGALAYLNDMTTILTRYQNYTIIGYVNALLTTYNEEAKPNRKIYGSLNSGDGGVIAVVSQSGIPIPAKDYTVETESVLTYITELADYWGLRMRIRKTSAGLVLDLLTDNMISDMCTQEIHFGRNLLDYTDNADWSDIVTVIHPIGAKLDTTTRTQDEDYPDYLTLGDLQPSTSGFYRKGEYLINRTAKDTYGWICETVEWSEVDDPQVLMQLAELYLQDYQYSTKTIKIKALDLSYLIDSNEMPFEFLQKVNCFSIPHGMISGESAQTFIIAQMDIPFDHPENTTFTFERSTNGSYGSDKKSTSYSGKISNATANITPKSSILKEAKINAFSLVEMGTTGFVTLVPATINDHNRNDRTSEIMITDNINPENATRRWRWNVNGLYHQHRASASDQWVGSNLDVAITMDGAIVANKITTGDLTVVANVYDPNITDGILFSANMTTNTVKLAGFTVKYNALWCTGRSELMSTNAGVYVGNDGISTGDGDLNIRMYEGIITGSRDSSGVHGYLAFNTKAVDASISSYDSSDYGTRLAGRSVVGILTNGVFGVGQYVDPLDDVTLAEGVSTSIRLVSQINFDSNGAITDVTYENFSFVNGLLNTR